MNVRIDPTASLLEQSLLRDLCLVSSRCAREEHGVVAHQFSDYEAAFAQLPQLFKAIPPVFIYSHARDDGVSGVTASARSDRGDIPLLITWQLAPQVVVTAEYIAGRPNAPLTPETIRTPAGLRPSREILETTSRRVELCVERRAYRVPYGTTIESDTDLERALQSGRLVEDVGLTGEQARPIVYLPCPQPPEGDDMGGYYVIVGKKKTVLGGLYARANRLSLLHDEEYDLPYVRLLARRAEVHDAFTVSEHRLSLVYSSAGASRKQKSAAYRPLSEEDGPREAQPGAADQDPNDNDRDSLFRKHSKKNLHVLWFSASWLKESVPAVLLCYAFGISNPISAYKCLGGDRAMVQAEPEYWVLRETERVADVVLAEVLDVEAEDLTGPRRVLGSRAILLRLGKLQKRSRVPLRRVQRLWEGAYEQLFFPQCERSSVVVLGALHDMAMHLFDGYTGRLPTHGRDLFVNKEYLGSGALLKHVVIKALMIQMRMACKEAMRLVAKTGYSRLTVARLNKMRGWRLPGSTVHILYPFRTGVMKSQRGLSRSGLVAPLDEHNHHAAIAHLRSCAVRLSRGGGTPDENHIGREERELDGSSYGIICPADTPDGKSVGLRVYPAAGAVLQTGLSADARRALLDLIFRPGASPVVHIHYLLTTLMEMASPDKCTDLLTAAVSLSRGPDTTPEDIFANAICSMGQAVRVILDGVYFSSMDATEVEPWIRDIKSCRANSAFAGFSVEYSPGDRRVLIETRGGRLSRPALIVDGGTVRLEIDVFQYLRSSRADQERITWNSLVATRCVEVIDAAELSCAMLWSPGYGPLPPGGPRQVTHLDLDPAFMCSVVLNTIPVPQTNPIPRNLFHCQITRTTIGGARPGHTSVGSDTTDLMLCYPQRPLHTSSFGEYTGTEGAYPTTTNTLMAVLSVVWNSEDGGVVDRTAMDFGLGMYLRYMTVTVTEKISLPGIDYDDGVSLVRPPQATPELGDLFVDHLPNWVEDKTPMPPNPTKKQKAQILAERAKRLPARCSPESWPGEEEDQDPPDNDGLAEVGAIVKAGDVLVTLILAVPHPEDPERLAYVDHSVTYQHALPARVVSIMVSDVMPERRVITVRLGQFRTNVVGDKGAYPTAQKHTDALIMRPEDGYTVATPGHGLSGCRVERILNGHSLAGRMTMVVLLASLAGLHTCYTGEFFNATPFRSTGVDVPGQGLRKVLPGTGEFGLVRLRNGTTGMLLGGGAHYGAHDTLVAVGFVPWHKLCYTVTEKIQSRARGPYCKLTRQPTGGKKKKGGQRGGEMERDCQIAHGAAFLLKDFFFWRSDAHESLVCPKCQLLDCVGLQGRVTDRPKVFICLRCKGTNLYRIQIPYAFKLLVAELASIGIAMRFGLGDAFKPTTIGEHRGRATRMLIAPQNSRDFQEGVLFLE